MKALTLFEEQRLTLEKSIQLTAESLNKYLPDYKHVAIAYSGGKDSTATVTVICHLIETGQIQQPESLTVLYADTRQELPPLQICAIQVLRSLEERGIKTQVVLPQMDKRFLPYILGRGVPPPNNMTLRWCTRQIKLDPMAAALKELRAQLKPNERLLMLTGVRQGESAIRDQRISLSCSKNGTECGQGWFQTMTAPQTDTLAPILHWRVCHVWEWLWLHAPSLGFDTSFIAEAYGGEEAEEINARTGCIGCPLASKDVALDALIKQSQWAYLAPLKRLRIVYEELRKFNNRLQKDGSETRKDGSLVSNPMRKGPITLAAREWALAEILDIQKAINDAAINQGRVSVNLIDLEEEAFIRKCIHDQVWPQGWDGSEPRGDALLPEVLRDGSIQGLLFGEEAFS